MFAEILIALRFSAVGIFATVLHFTIAVLFISAFDIPTQIANLIAFVSAWGVSFTGNYFWTFKRPGDLKAALKRYLVISITVFLINALILNTLIQQAIFSDIFSITISTLATPFITFLLSRFYGFNTSGKI